MFDFYHQFTLLEKAYLWSAVLGGLMFVIRTAIQFVGGIDAEVGDMDPNGVDSDVSFKLLSLEGVTAFFMMFGLVGLAMLKTTDLGDLVATLVATIAGLLSIWVIKRIFDFMMSLQSDGTLDLNNAIGAEAKVYLGIKPPEPGKIQVVLQNRLMIYDAISNNEEEIPTGTQVKVIDLKAGNTFVVQKL